MRPAETTGKALGIPVVTDWGWGFSREGGGERGDTSGRCGLGGRPCGGGRPGRRRSGRGASSSGAGAARASRSRIASARRRRWGSGCGEQGSRETIDAGLVDFVWTLDPAPVEGRETRRAELAPHGSAGGLVVLRFCPPSLLPSVNLPDAWNSVFFLERTCVCFVGGRVVCLAQGWLTR